MKTKFITVLLLLVVLLVGSIPLGCTAIGCEPLNYIRLTITNNTDKEISVQVYMQYIKSVPYEIGVLSPGQAKKHVFDTDWIMVRIVHVLVFDNEGFLILYREFGSLEVQKLRGKITITDEPDWRQRPYWFDGWGEPPWKTR